MTKSSIGTFSDAEFSDAECRGQYSQKSQTLLSTAKIESGTRWHIFCDFVKIFRGKWMNSHSTRQPPFPSNVIQI